MEQNCKNSIGIYFSYHLDEQVWGEIRQVQAECPGVFYLGMSATDAHPYGRELFAVTPEAARSIISEEVLAYGIAEGEVYLFEYGVEHSGYTLVQYEICRYRKMHGIPESRETGSLYCTAVYAAEQYPEYFGGLLPPRNTPFGLTVRCKKAAEGLYFLETDQCQWILAVAYPIWSCDLSNEVQKLGCFCEVDLRAKELEARYLFFEESRCAPAIYELLEVSEYQGLTKYISSRSVLETELCLNYPEYTLHHNFLEMAGHGRSDLLNDLLSAFGGSIPDEPESEAQRAQRISNCIHLNEEAVGRRLLTLPS